LEKELEKLEKEINSEKEAIAKLPEVTNSKF